jgi:chromosome segregation ATPase
MWQKEGIMQPEASNRAKELLANIEKQKQQTNEDLTELTQISKDLKSQAEVLLAQANQIDEHIGHARNLGGVATRNRDPELDRFMKELKEGPNHTYDQCYDTAVGGCPFHADGC